MFETMGRESRDLVKSLVSLVYFMRGGMSLNDMWWTTHGEREIIKEFLDARFEAESKNPHPQY